jgi:hypothetical protein
MAATKVTFRGLRPPGTRRPLSGSTPDVFRRKARIVSVQGGVEIGISAVKVTLSPPMCNGESVSAQAPLKSRLEVDCGCGQHGMQA